ncbi:hypothetical protein Pat9b_3467 [Pantoea sp. At-9b]|nr:hypothetical protein Pat9b_3467 [Pantoea sp. At-9b]
MKRENLIANFLINPTFILTILWYSLITISLVLA